MLIKLIHRRAMEPKRPKDLRRLLNYLFTPKLSRTPLPTPPRLLGPPIVENLIQQHLPWGASVDLAAADLTQQMVTFTRNALQGQPFPHLWYAHIVMSFAPGASDLLTQPIDDRPGKMRTQAGNAMRIGYDVLDAFGWTPTLRPGVHVVHGDRRHIHIHSVIVLPSPTGVIWDIYRVGRRQFIDYGEACRQGYGLPKTSRTAARHHVRWSKL